MRTNKILTALCILCLLLPAIVTPAQEHTGPVRYNPWLANHQNSNKKSAEKTTALSLPVFEDFTGYSIYPDNNLWLDSEVYINNTMCTSPISRGVATFDALDKTGMPYDPYNSVDFRYADSLTSRPIDLSGHTPADSLYLSFFYQPQGNGYFPLPADSFILYMKIVYGDWLPVWQVAGTTIQPFTQVMIPITDTLYFHSTFQFRFVNIAALNFADANWNLDYIRLDANRNMNDTEIADVAFSADPSYLLNDYTSMPYRQFYANITAERATQFVDSIHNDYLATPVTVNYTFSATALNTGTVLQVPVTNTTTISPSTIQPIANPAYTTTIPPPGYYDKVVFENQYYIGSTGLTGSIPNDTIIKDQVFDNYLAYDDGTAEQSYYITLFSSLPGYIAIEHHLNIPDTMRGMAIYFGRQGADAYDKIFSIVVYSSLAGVNGATADNIVYESDFLNPGYIDTINHFWIYSLDSAIALPAGTFYAGVFIPAESGSDSLYFGLDVNRIGGNHAYYNVLSAWSPSLIHGAIMMRPILGKNITSSEIPGLKSLPTHEWTISPNPASDKLTITFPGDLKADYQVTNITGIRVLSGLVNSGTAIDISALAPGMYFVSISSGGIQSTTQKFIKL